MRDGRLGGGEGGSGRKVVKGRTKVNGQTSGLEVRMLCSEVGMKGLKLG